MSELTTDQYIRRMAELAIDASPDHLRVLVAIAERMARGNRDYGPLDIATNPRNWDTEMREELLDCIVYATIAEMKEASRERKTDPCPAMATCVEGDET